MSEASPIRIPVHYDLASSLCYVAHRVLERMAPFLAETELVLDWTPIDLSRLMGWRPGAPVLPHRLEDVRQIATHLEVQMRVPTRWQDSSGVAAATLALLARDRRDGSALEPSFRERIYTAVYEQGGRCDEPGLVERVQADMALRLDAQELAEGAEQLDRLTRDAAGRQVTGVPTFMLGEFPFGGIQEEATMRSILGRYARQRRRNA